MARSQYIPVIFLVSSLNAPLIAPISRLITDRFALPAGVTNDCDPAKQLRCGGTWNSIRENLDYISNAGFTASTFKPLISRSGKRLKMAVTSLDLPHNTRHRRHHGVWRKLSRVLVCVVLAFQHLPDAHKPRVADATKLNSHMGTSEDLKALSAELHSEFTPAS